MLYTHEKINVKNNLQWLLLSTRIMVIRLSIEHSMEVELILMIVMIINHEGCRVEKEKERCPPQT